MNVINWQAGGVLTISMDYACQLSSVLIDLGDAEVANSKFKTGSNFGWYKLAGGGFETGIQNAGEGISKELSVAKMRLVNVSDTEQKVYFKIVPFYGELIWFLILKIELRAWDDAPRCS